MQPTGLQQLEASYARRNRENASALELAANECREAIDFYDRVIASDSSEQLAVGTDHIEWIVRATRRVAELAPKLD